MDSPCLFCNGSEHIISDLLSYLLSSSVRGSITSNDLNNSQWRCREKASSRYRCVKEMKVEFKHGSLAPIVDIVPSPDTGCMRISTRTLSQGNRDHTASSLVWVPSKVLASWFRSAYLWSHCLIHVYRFLIKRRWMCKFLVCGVSSRRFFFFDDVNAVSG